MRPGLTDCLKWVTDVGSGLTDCLKWVTDVGSGRADRFSSDRLFKWVAENSRLIDCLYCVADVGTGLGIKCINNDFL